MIGKVIVSGVSLILVVGVIIGVVVTVHRSNGSNDAESLSPQMKAVSALCQPTYYKEACTNTLSALNSTDPKELIKGGILAISASLKNSFNVTDDLVAKTDNASRDKMALIDCKELLQNASESVEDTLSKVGEIDLLSLSNRTDDFRTWLSSIIGYQEMCLDGFENGNSLRDQVQKSTDYGSELTDNVLNILAGLSQVLNSLGLKLNVPSTSRQLLQANGFPTWMSASDRKLLASRGNGGVRPNAVVAQDGSGQFKTINAALAAYPKNLKGRYVIYVKAGTYREYVAVAKDQPNVFIYGDGSRKTIVTGNKNFAKDGLGTWKTATFIVEANGFIAKSIGFTNTAGPDGHQAVAIRTNSDMSAFYNCRFDGYQDTVLYQAGRQFYRNCVLSGTVDFLFGYGSAVIQNSLIIVRRPNPNQFNTVTADGRKERGQPGGLVIHNCRIVPEQKLVPDRLKIKTYLGRPWKAYSRTVVMESKLADFIQPDGWAPWSGNQFLDTLYYAEYANAGPGAATNRRVRWKTLHFLKRSEALQFTVGAFLQGGQWIRSNGIPVLMGLRK
ncbi:PREDICTED: pectinesterase-like [Populus euphratica]|uniref:pectinesterase n=1 Tax=Populus euphratica TaxID=75702 RepID=A0AAJ6TBX5_POPEU|nr:PREDICTED: pectinesterase-like [Populus euphratica]